MWFGGLYALPFLHSLDHRADHTHGAPGHSHPHPPPHSEPHAHDAAPADEPGREPLDPDHGEGSLLHFAAVVVGSQPAVLPKLPDAIVPVSVGDAPSVDTPALLAFLARGPPAP